MVVKYAIPAGGETARMRWQSVIATIRHGQEALPELLRNTPGYAFVTTAYFTTVGSNWQYRRMEI